MPRQLTGTKRPSTDRTSGVLWKVLSKLFQLACCCVLIYIAAFEHFNINHDQRFNFIRGIGTVTFALVIIGLKVAPGGRLKSPHPVFWNLILCASVLYLLFLLFLLFQTADDARLLLKELDRSLGEPLPEKNYSSNCIIYDSNIVENPYHNILSKFDGFVPAHIIGWWLKTLMVRDFWLAHVLSIAFELLEYTLEHQLPNFAECWWDHWILDMLVCNSFGIWLGMRTAHWVNLRPFSWRGTWYELTPEGPIVHIKNWFSVCGMIVMFELAELNAFYLKSVLWFPPDHILCLGRLVFISLIGAEALTELFHYLNNKKECKQLECQAQVLLGVIMTESLLVLKYEPETVLKALPWKISMLWCLGLSALAMFTLWRFVLRPPSNKRNNLRPNSLHSNGKVSHSLSARPAQSTDTYETDADQLSPECDDHPCWLEEYSTNLDSDDDIDRMWLCDDPGANLQFSGAESTTSADSPSAAPINDSKRVARPVSRIRPPSVNVKDQLSTSKSIKSSVHKRVSPQPSNCTKIPKFKAKTS